MNRHVQPHASRKMQPLLTERPNGAATPAEVVKTPKGRRFGEVAGGTAAECAAICCCCPCTLMNLLVLAVVKAPACLCRKAKQRRRMMRRRKKTQQLLGADNNSVDGGGTREDLETEVRQFVERSGAKDGGDGDGAVDLEKEMWDRFFGTGFWRSPSQRGT